VAASALVACAAEPPAPRSVLFVVVDTLRWDRVGAYGYARDTTPAIDALAATGVRFERAYATAPWTLPSIASMLTGLYPSAHGVKTAANLLPAAVETLPEMLHRRGYVTGAVVSNKLLRARPGEGFSRGYDVYRAGQARGPNHVSTQGVTQQAVALLRRFAADPKGRPFFLLVHYFDPHFNYRAHAGIDFAPPRMGRLDGSQGYSKLAELIRDLDDEELRFLGDLYDEEVHLTDAGIGRLLRALQNLELESQTLVVVTSDHGEEFGEHGALGHMKTLYEELVRVPLVLRVPWDHSGPRVVRTPVSLASLTPTVLDLLGVDAPDAAFGAESLAGVLRGEPEPDSRFVFVEVERGNQSRRTLAKTAIVGERLKLIRNERTGALEIYDLENDPGERIDLAEAQPELRELLLPRLDEQLERAGEGAAPAASRELSEEEVEGLRQLGYFEP